MDTSLAHATGVDWHDVQAAAETKRSERGGFERNVVLLETSWPGWSTAGRAPVSFTIPLSGLSQVSERDGVTTVPYPLLLAAGARPRVVLPDGTAVEVSMSGEGVAISGVQKLPVVEEQPTFEF